MRRDFVANISHELRTPLASIKLLAETLSGGAVDDPQTAHDFTLQIEREVDHLTQLVDELLDLSMIESGETRLSLEPLNPDERGPPTWSIGSARLPSGAGSACGHQPGSPKRRSGRAWPIRAGWARRC